MKSIKKIIFLFIIILLITGIYTTVSGKYVIEYTNKVANIDIDRGLPYLRILEIKNSNIQYPKYANKTHTITYRVKIEEKNIKEDNFNKEHIKILIDEKEIVPDILKINLIEKTNTYVIYDILISGIKENGKFSIKICEGCIVDTSGNKSTERYSNPNIQIDNVAPSTIFEQIETTNGKVKANIQIDEPIQDINGWNITEDKKNLTKEFENNLTYFLPVRDYAQNQSNTKVDITKATNIQLEYGSCNQLNESDFRDWSFGTGNGEVAGKEAVSKNPIWKTLMLGFSIEGNVEKDFLQVQTYIHTYWGEGNSGMSEYETTYKHGYNPNEGTYETTGARNSAHIKGKWRFIFGGGNINWSGYTGSNLGKPIPEDIASKSLFGISGLKIKLKDYSYYSIVYQILVNGYGWQKTVSDEQEATYSHDKPFSAYRVCLVPKTEKQYVMDFWNKDIGTYNVK